MDKEREREEKTVCLELLNYSIESSFKFNSIYFNVTVAYRGQWF